ncbi:MAG: class I adenylate-forming enzyme family protein [Candidatus Binatia bacterium]
MSTIVDAIDRAAAEHGERIALRFRGRSTSCAELAGRSNALAERLASIGLGAGSRLGVLMGNRPEWLVAALGAARVGAVVVPLSTFLRARELESILRHAEVEAVVHSPRFSGTSYDEVLVALVAPRGAPALSCLLEWRDDEALPRIRGEAVERRSPRPARSGDAAFVFYTSGSTGEPKGVRHAHGPMLRHARAIAERMGTGPDDRSWSTFPFFFSAGIMIFAWSGLAAGATLVLQEKFEPAEALALLESERCTMYQGWPHQIEAMIAEPRFSRTDLGTLRKSNGAKFLPHEAFLRRPHEAIDGWGMTETLTYCCSTRWTDPLETRLASHGTPLEGVEVRVVDADTGRPLGPGEDGELCVRGYNVMLGYVGRPEGSHLDGDGYFRSGDLGRIDAAGNVHFLGRLREIIKTAGVNVAAAEIEQLLAGHPAVEAAYVVGVPDPSRGETIAAFVVRAAACDEAELARFVADRTARYKVPRWIFFTSRDELPQTGTGKVLQTRLREIAVDRAGKGTLGPK